MQAKTDKEYLQLAIKQAEKSVAECGFPAGAVLVKDGDVVAEGVSLGSIINDPTSHAETAAIRAACQKLQTSNLSGSTLYGSIECCNMCFSVAYWAGVSRVVFACRKNPELVKKLYYEGSTNNKLLNENNNRKMELTFVPDLEEESLKVVKKWEEMA